jgi:uncharacterized protein YfiM (DUF2279 family)
MIKDSIFSYDKLAHFIVSTIIVVGVGIIGLDVFKWSMSTSLLVGDIVALMVGIGKEVYDSRNRGFFSFLDLVADALGIAAASVTVIYFLSKGV